MKNPELEKSLNPQDSELKEMLVNYIGNKLNPEDDQVTVEMAVEVLSTDFPELLLALAEENFLRGYEQALADVESNRG